jgi:hypothetical protein
MQGKKPVFPTLNFIYVKEHPQIAYSNMIKKESYLCPLLAEDL